MRTYMRAELTWPRKLPPIVVSVVRTEGISRISDSIVRMASSMAARLVPSGALMVTSNSASSTLLGTYSCRTSP